MALTLDAEVEVKSSADKFWTDLRQSTILFPKIFPEDYKSISVLEGDGKSPGSVRVFHYGEGKVPMVHLQFSPLSSLLRDRGIASAGPLILSQF